jgi:hypothetical protein
MRPCSPLSVVFPPYVCNVFALLQAVRAAVGRLPATASLSQVEGDVIEAVQKAARWFNNRKPEVIAVAWEHDPRAALAPDLAARAAASSQPLSRPAAAPGSHRPSRPAAAADGPSSSSSGSIGSSSAGGGSSGSGSGSAPPRRVPPRVRRNTGGTKQLPPLQVLPKDVELPVTHQNPRQNPAAAGPDADLAYD